MKGLPIRECEFRFRLGWNFCLVAGLGSILLVSSDEIN